MNDAPNIKTLARPVKRSAHDEARQLELDEQLADDANANSGPYMSVGDLHEFTAKCGCWARRSLDTDGEGVWREWRWSSINCTAEQAEEI